MLTLCNLALTNAAAAEGLPWVAQGLNLEEDGETEMVQPGHSSSSGQERGQVSVTIWFAVLLKCSRFT